MPLVVKNKDINVLILFVMLTENALDLQSRDITDDDSLSNCHPWPGCADTQLASLNKE
jgi:hypothetical protein